MGLEVLLFGVTFRNPVLVAAGTCGFGREVAAVTRLEALGGLVTKSVTVLPRAGNPPPRVAEFEAGMLNSVGLANPGAAEVRGERLPWIEAHLPALHVFVSVAGHTAGEYLEVVRMLDDGPGFLGFELNLSCPNDSERGGLPFAHDPKALGRVVAGGSGADESSAPREACPEHARPVSRRSRRGGGGGRRAHPGKHGPRPDPRSALGAPAPRCGGWGHERPRASASRPLGRPDGSCPHGAPAHRRRGDRTGAGCRRLPRGGRIPRTGGYGLVFGSPGGRTGSERASESGSSRPGRPAGPSGEGRRRGRGSAPRERRSWLTRRSARTFRGQRPPSRSSAALPPRRTSTSSGLRSSPGRPLGWCLTSRAASDGSSWT